MSSASARPQPRPHAGLTSQSGVCRRARDTRTLIGELFFTGVRQASLPPEGGRTGDTPRDTGVAAIAGPCLMQPTVSGAHSIYKTPFV